MSEDLKFKYVWYLTDPANPKQKLRERQISCPSGSQLCGATCVASPIDCCFNNTYASGGKGFWCADGQLCVFNSTGWFFCCKPGFFGCPFGSTCCRPSHREVTPETCQDWQAKKSHREDLERSLCQMRDNEYICRFYIGVALDQQ